MTSANTWPSWALQGPADQVVDLGAGRGRTLSAITRRSPASTLTAVDIDEHALSAAAGTLPQVQTLRRDLALGLPLNDDSVDIVVSHNTLECLIDPLALLEEVARVLRPGGRAILSHTDFESIVVVAGDRDLNRRILLTYAELPILYRHMANADAQMGRRLAGLVRRSALQSNEVRTHTTVIPTLAAARAARLAEIATSVRTSAQRGVGHVTAVEVETWIEHLRTAEHDGDFLYSETAYIVTAIGT